MKNKSTKGLNLCGGNLLCRHVCIVSILLMSWGVVIHSANAENLDTWLMDKIEKMQHGIKKIIDKEKARQNTSGSYRQNDPVAGRYIELTLEAQDRLNRLGYDAGPVDGVIGSKTRSAIREFQRDDGTPVDGRVNQFLVSRLRRVDAAEIGSISSRATSYAPDSGVNRQTGQARPENYQTTRPASDNNHIAQTGTNSSGGVSLLAPTKSTYGEKKSSEDQGFAFGPERPPTGQEVSAALAKLAPADKDRVLNDRKEVITNCNYKAIFASHYYCGCFANWVIMKKLKGDQRDATAIYGKMLFDESAMKACVNPEGIKQYHYRDCPKQLSLMVDPPRNAEGFCECYSGYVADVITRSPTTSWQMLNGIRVKALTKCGKQFQ